MMMDIRLVMGVVVQIVMYHCVLQMIAVYGTGGARGAGGRVLMMVVLHRQPAAAARARHQVLEAEIRVSAASTGEFEAPRAPLHAVEG